jgi:hypothetical protein
MMSAVNFTILLLIVYLVGLKFLSYFAQGSLWQWRTIAKLGCTAWD